ncbi:MAG: secretion system protein [Clostridiaceae bacterium]|jgi:pilus assembly protein CpaF|nr:secretion system protein [Clostridiaceae bacterium]
METDFKSFKKDINKFKNQKQDGVLLDYEEALEIVREAITEKKMGTTDDTKDDKEIVIKDKEYLRKKMKLCKLIVEDVVYSKNMHIRGYDKENLIDKFINEMVSEFVGYSILDEAFEDDEVSDIFVINWKTIFVEKKGVNIRYWKTFRNEKHCKNTIERFLREAGKEINLGDKSIVDFELYGDRGCATSPVVSPKGYSLTIRKHAEDHVTREQLINGGVLTEKMSDFLGMIITGECNVIYAGKTGSGKTTTLRALIDYYITKANKRIVVNEDTQELFLLNEHTLELITVKSDKEKAEINLSRLIKTALRLKPKYILVGEVRGEEAMDAVEGAETGHSTLFTMHGGNVWNVLNRLTTKYLMAIPSLGIDVVERIIGEAIDYIGIQDNIPGIGRKLSSLTEISYDFEKRRIVVKPIIEYDFEKQDFVWLNKISKEKATKMLRSGVPLEELKNWIED